MTYLVGDKVILIKDLIAPNGGSYESIKKGSTGIICRLNRTGTVGVRFDNYTGGHDCLGDCEYGKGLHVKVQDLKEQEKTIEDNFEDLVRLLE